MLEHRLPVGCRVVFKLGDPPEVAADGGQLLQVFANIILNAAQAIHREDGLIRIETLASDNQLLVHVDDNGPGIPDTLLGKIFDPFFSTKANTKGLGLGLALSSEHVHHHGGRLLAGQSELGGARITVELPRRTGLVPSGPSLAPEVPLRRATSRILLIDDEPKVLDVFRQILEREHDVATAESGQAALRLTKTDSQFDLVLCDIALKDMDGFTLRERIRESHPQLATRMVFCTGGVLSEGMAERLDAEPQVLYKPILATNLLHAVRSYLAPAAAVGKPGNP
ncbi:MAG TPA: ATP-binding protein [Polyangiaceae bacterium]|nr:ATP-binding protein [Polyangiaceae bacterium]